MNKLWYIENKDGMAFVIPFDKENAAFIKRQETALSWARQFRHAAPQNKTVGITIDNNFVEGYQILECDTRLTTSANHYTIQHPVGFKFQIPASEMMNVILNCKIDKGLIEGKFKIIFEGSRNRIVPEEPTGIDLKTASGVFIYTKTKKDDSMCIANGIMHITAKDGSVTEKAFKHYSASKHYQDNTLYIHTGVVSKVMSFPKAVDFTQFDKIEMFEYNRPYSHDATVTMKFIDGVLHVYITSSYADAEEVKKNYKK